MKNLCLAAWKWINEDGKPGAFMWATLTVAAAIVFTMIAVLIWRLGRNWRLKKAAEAKINGTTVVINNNAESFEKRNDNQLDY
ncbi:MAG: hypothetical protein J5598_00135, partial [Clostridia bacterium]|nr:hypothetical protein [Clostridia bacterium]